KPVPFANVFFTNSSVGSITNDDGTFYIESKNSYDSLTVSYMGYETKTLVLTSNYATNLRIQIKPEASALGQVVIYQGKTSKKNNPAIDILRKIWENKRKNGLNQFDYYEYDKYEKVEFDINTIDSALINSRIFKGIEFIFDQIDTSRVTGKNYLPIFINEALYEIYGSNLYNKEKEIVIGNKNSGFSNNKTLVEYVQNLYEEYNVYENYIKIFEKSFTSPLSTTGINMYNYVLADSAFIDNKWCYKIVYYPRRKNELTFKGDFWVNDTTWAIKEINLQVTKSANINWTRDLYIEQEFEVLNDSVFLIKRDYFLSDFSLSDKKTARGIYGKRTTLYDDYKFDVPRSKEFYDLKPDPYRDEIYNRVITSLNARFMKPLNKVEKKVYNMLDML